jgi:chemotaxis protein methyltransferase CheR
MPGRVKNLRISESANNALCEKAGRLLHARAGIVLGEHKMGSTQRILNTLSERFSEGDPGEFLRMLEHDAQHDAWPDFINAFTINHTAFFREPHHFERLEAFLRSRPQGCAIWCAAASTGEEPYSIAMVAEEVYGSGRSNYSILATDIDTKVLAYSQKGIYPLSRADGVGQARLKQHFLRGVGKQLGKAKIRPHVQSRVSFAAFNLNDASWSVPGTFDVIFCRNTMIYFDKPTQQRLLKNFARVMPSGGLLFVGHSESIIQLTDDFSLLGQTVYQRK